MKAYLCVILCVYSIFFNWKVLGATSSVSWLISKDHAAAEIDSMAMYHIDKAYRHLRKFNIDSAKINLDSATLYKKKITDPLILGHYYTYSGIYYSFKQEEIESHTCYYKALENYEKAEETDFVTTIYNNLAFSYIQKHDTENLEKIIGKMHTIALKRQDQSDLVKTYRVYAFYFYCLYEKDKKETSFLDSAIYYNKKTIDIFENNKALKIRDEEMAYSYLHIASALLESHSVDPELVSIYIKKSEELMNVADSAMIRNQLRVKGIIAYKQNRYIDAERIFSHLLTLMDDRMVENPLDIYVEIYSIMAEIAEIQKNYGNALIYERKRIECLTKIHDAQKYGMIRELETKYEVRQKEEAINQLTQLTSFQRKINYLSLSLFLACSIAFIFLIRWIIQKKKASDVKLKLACLEKHDAMIQVQLREEQMKKIELEKYEALLVSYFKNAEITEELRLLQEKQQELNTLISEYDIQVKRYKDQEARKPVFGTRNEAYRILLQDIYLLINKRLDKIPEKEEYIERLLEINDHFFRQLKVKAKHEMSALNIRHCIGIYINLTTKHFATCFSIEPGSVRNIKNRLKNRLKMDKDMDLNIFLKQLGECSVLEEKSLE